MKNRTGTIIALLATSVACALASAIAVRVGPVPGIPGSMLVALTRKAAEGKGGVAVLFTARTTGTIAVRVLAQRD